MLVIVLNGISTSMKAVVFENSISLFSCYPYDVVIRDPVQSLKDLPKNDTIATMRIVVGEKAVYIYTGENWKLVCEVADMTSAIFK